MEMEPHNKLVLEEEEENDEEEEEEASLQGRHSQLHRQNSQTSDDTNGSIANGKGNANANGHGNSSSLHQEEEDSQTPKGISPCESPPHKHHHSSITTTTGDWYANMGGNEDGEGDGTPPAPPLHNHSSVYFDQNPGIWKCCHCNWTYSIASPRIDHQDCSHISETEGVDSIDGVSDRACGGVTCPVSETSPSDVEVFVKNSDIQTTLMKDVSLKFGENLDNEGFSGSSLTPLGDTFEEQNFKSKPSNSKTTVVGGLDLMEGVDEEFTELDVEKVLEKQNTHDLYCPNCNSCITRRVILCRRRRKIRNSRRKPKHDKFNTILPSGLDNNSTYIANDPAQDTANICDSSAPAADAYTCDKEPDVFRCLSCFSFFIPTGNGFKLFRVSSDENENVQDSLKISTGNTNWFFSIFSTDKRKTTTEQADHSQLHGIHRCFPNKVSSMKLADRTIANNGEVAGGFYANPQQSGMVSLSPTKEHLLLEKSPERIDPKLNLRTRNGTVADQNAILSSIDLPSFESSSIAGLVNDMTSASHEAVMEIVSSSTEHKSMGSTLTNTRDTSDHAAENSGGASMNHSIVHSGDMPSCSNNMRQDLEKDCSVMPFSSSLVNSGEPAENASWRHWRSTANSQESSTSEFLILKQPQIEIDENSSMTIVNEKPFQNGQASSSHGTSLPTQLYSKGELINNTTIEHQEVRKVALNSLSQGTLMPEKGCVNIAEKAVLAMENKNTSMHESNDVILTVAVEREAPEHGYSEIVASYDSGEPSHLVESTDQTDVGEKRHPGQSDAQQWEILKSIVYGGLIESITSLGVVSSAAGAGATTLNIIALGLANLIGGLFVIGHNLMDLKNDRSGEVSDQLNEQEDRYQETLGRRENFALHATMSILSFLIFGVLAPVIYGFSFQKSDDRDLKLAAVGAVSLVCITLLAIGKAHTQRKQPKPYISTVLYFASIGFMASGASYLAGELISKLLHKFSGFETRLALTFPFQELKQMEPSWASH